MKEMAEVMFQPLPLVFGKIFVGDRDGVLHALNQNTGKPVWVRPLESGDIFGPALAYNKVFTISLNGVLFAIGEETGEIIWNTKIAAAPSINVADNRLFISAFNGTFYCINATSGATLWSGDLVASSVETYMITHPAVAEGRVFLGAVCLNETDGSTLWNVTLGGQVQGIGLRNFPAFSEGRVFIGVNDTMYCLDAFTGSVLWNQKIGSEIFKAPPAIAYDMVFVPSADGVFYCLDAQSGTIIWTKSGVGGIVQVPYGSTSGGAAVADGKVFLPNPDWAVICLNSTNGEVIWRFLTEGSPAPPIVASGAVFVTLVHDPQVYAFGKSSTTPSDFQIDTLWLAAAVVLAVVAVAVGTIVYLNRRKR